MIIHPLVYVLITAHLVGDWWLQTNEMALGKSKNSWNGLWALTRHVTVVCAVLYPSVVAYSIVTTGTGTGLSDESVVTPAQSFAAVNFVAHWVTDFITSRINASQWYVECRIYGAGNSEGVQEVRAEMELDAAKRFWFWRGIGSDQWIHYVTLFVTAQWLLS